MTVEVPKMTVAIPARISLSVDKHDRVVPWFVAMGHTVRLDSAA